MIKGGGGALTREKIVADLAERFVCIADGSKLVDRLGRFPLPVEVVPMAAAQIGRRFVAMGGRPVLREGVVTDNGGHILDVHGLAIDDPAGDGGRGQPVAGRRLLRHLRPQPGLDLPPRHRRGRAHDAFLSRRGRVRKSA